MRFGPHEKASEGKYASAENVAKGAYVVASDKDPEVVLIGTGSEVSLALEAHEKLAKDGIRAACVGPLLVPCRCLAGCDQLLSYRCGVGDHRTSL